ncbi:MAG: leucyl aminopeptidase [Bacteroidota bacterium]
MEFQLSNQHDHELDFLIIPLAKTDDLPNILADIAQKNGFVAAQLQQDFKAEQGSRLALYPNAPDQPKLYLLGLGGPASFSDTLKAFRSLAYQLKEQLGTKAGISFLYGNAPQKLTTLQRRVEAAINGLLLGTYDIGLYKQPTDNQHPLSSAEARLTVFADADDDASLLQSLRVGQQAALAQLSVMNLVNAPGNKARPAELAQWAVDSGQHFGYTVQVFDKAAIEDLGLHALLAVNRGSEWPPAFIVMEYKGPGLTENSPTFGLLGKGVTFDTGGISIKGSSNMHYMKSDMGGAAAVLGTMELCARLQLPVHLVGLVPTTDNCVDATAIKPGDVIGSYSGKTIEVTDTDAEGRLILADALAYMLKHYDPTVMIDLATLTGSCVRALGYQAAGLFTNNDQLALALQHRGEDCGERVWRLPLWEAYKRDIESDVADVKNYSGRPVAGAINAAKFLEAFTEQHPNWAHLDIAGVAFGDSEFANGKSATGYGIRLLYEFIHSYEGDKE